MRIGIDIRELEKGKMTGIGRFLLNFLNFVKLNDKENEYVLLANQNSRKLDSSDNIRLKIIPSFSKLYWDQVTLAKQINREKLDIFFSPTYAAPVFSRAKLIVTCHDLFFLNSSKNPLANWLRRFYSRVIWKRADLIITVSEYSKKEILKFLGSDAQKVRVVYDSVDARFTPMDKEALFNNLSKKFPALKKDFILYVGNLKPHKNIRGLVTAYNLMPDSLKDKFQLVIAGEKVRDFNFPESVVFLDAVNEDDLLSLYNAATVLTLVSFHEGFGLPALEAMACGLPVIVSNVTSLPEVAGDAGLYVNPYDVEGISWSIQRLITDESLRKELSAKGIEQAKKFEAKNSANKLLEIFKEIGRK